MTAGGAAAPTQGPRVALVAAPEDFRRLAREIALIPGARLVEVGEADVLAVAEGVGGAEGLTVGTSGCDVIVCAPYDFRALAGLGPRVMAPGRLGSTEVGRRLLAELADGAQGRILSMFLAVRGPVGGRFEALLWDAVCLIDDCLGEPFSALHAEGGAMFGPGVDTAVVIARSATGAVVTADVSCCLPAGAAGAADHVEVEIMAEHATLRAMPFSRCVTVRSGGTVRDRFWGEDPLPAMIAEWYSGAAPDAMRLQRRLGMALGILDAVDPHGAGKDPE